jgi:hypothetical protein
MLRHVGFSQQIEVATTDPRPLARAVTGATAITCACANVLKA